MTIQARQKEIKGYCKLLTIMTKIDSTTKSDIDGLAKTILQLVEEQEHALIDMTDFISDWGL